MSTEIFHNTVPEAIQDIMSCDNLPGGFLVYRESDGCILSINSQILKLFDCNDNESFYRLTGCNFNNLIYEEDRESLRQNIRACEHAEQWASHNHYRIRTKGGKLIYIEEYRHRIPTEENGPVYFIFLSDLNTLTEDQRQDYITGLIGIRQFLHLADEYMKRDFPKDGAALLFVNLVNFRLLNLNYGLDAGDRFLSSVALKLRELFPDQFIARCDVDHFIILTPADHLETKLNMAYYGILSVLPKKMTGCKIGVCLWQDSSLNAEKAFTRAKLACESIRNSASRSIAYYTEEISRHLELSDYVISHLDEALDRGWILPYYQPIIRMISGNLCGLEALARWEDPVHGLLSPADFIPPLEKNHQIYRLDLYLIEQVCKTIHFQMKAGKDIVPVSVNLSRLDFISCDIFQETENIIRRYDVPRDMLHIEITESAFIENDAKMQKGIQQFRTAGYEIWMDDFGSGYSTLNMLKDYSFDVMKMDMAFLNSNSDKNTYRTKMIIRSVIEMDKRLKNRTLAEGVETEEQFLFLKNTGCDKAQGYYFGYPLPYDQCMEQCAKKNIAVEGRRWRKYFDSVGSVNFDPDRPLAIAEYDGTMLHFLYANDKFIQALKSGGTASLSECEIEINTTMTPFGRAFHLAVEYAAESDEEQVFDYPSRDQFMRLKTRNLAKSDGKVLFSARLGNITSTRNISQTSALLENLYYVYDDIMLIDIKGNLLHHILTEHDDLRATYDLRLRLRQYAKNRIHPLDFDRFMEFQDFDTLQERLHTSENGTLHGFFRTKEKTGDYHWKEYIFMRVPKMNKDILLTAVRQLNLNDLSCIIGSGDSGAENLSLSTNHQTELDRMKEKALLWDNLVQFSTIPFFWKDRNRRFRGASRSFLNYYGLQSENDIIGKTDEEMSWHIEADHYKEKEEEILTRGISSEFYPGKCVCRGVDRNIVATKHPIYDDGKIIGLGGFFIDVDYINRFGRKLALLPVTDSLSGLSNVRGMIETVFRYAESQRIHGIDYALITLQIPEAKRLIKSYGDAFCQGLIQEISSTIIRIVGNAGTAGRAAVGKYMIACQYTERQEVYDLAEDLSFAIQGIHEISGYSCTLFPKIQISFSSETENVEKLLFDSLLRTAETPEGTDSVTCTEELLSDPSFRYIIDHMSIGAYLVRPDRKILYWNHAAEQITGYSEKWIVGKTCPESQLLHLNKDGVPLCETFCPLLRTLETGKAHREKLWARHKDNYRILLEVVMIPIRDKTGTIIGAAELFDRVSKEQYSEDMVKSLYDAATHDPVSGLSGRRYMENYLKYKISEYRLFNIPFAVLFLDIDEFHQFNNLHGHDAGDRVLKTFGDAVSAGLRGTDVLGRWGGDEFLAVASVREPKDVQGLVNRMRAITQHLHVQSRTGETLSIRLSVGITIVREQDDADSIVDRADQYMYQAKKDSSGNAYYTDDDAERDAQGINRITGSGRQDIDEPPENKKNH